VPTDVATQRAHDGRALAAWGGVVGLGVVVGGWVTANHPRFHTDAAPFHGHWLLELRAGAVLPIGLATVLVVTGPAAAARLPWRRLLLAAPAAAFVWAAALSMSVGGHGFAQPLHERGGYLEGVALVGGPAHFLRTFTTALPGYPTHVKGHPPGLVLLLWALDRIGLGGPTWGAVLVVAVGASATAAVLLATADVAGRDAARRAAPFLVLAPGAVWLATSGDALFTGVAAWAVATSVLATGRRSRGLAVLAGTLWLAALLLSYGLALLAPPVLAVAWWRRRTDVVLALASATVGGLVVVGLATGYWWPAGLAATHRAYQAGYAAHRSAWAFLWLNASAFAVAIGPAVAPALHRLRADGVALLAGGALAGVALADLTLLSKGEVERIWLPWVPWALVATATLPVLRRHRWLAAQATTGIVVQLALRSTW
jgi:hypothetical protein